MQRVRDIISIIIAVAAGFVIATDAGASRIKDIADIGGVRDNQLISYGLVVGLAGTGDSIDNGFTKETLANMLSRQGLAMKDDARDSLSSDNVAAVVVTAELPPFAKVGTRIDVMVSSIGDADNLQGGTLLMTPLRGADGKVYAVAQGAIALGGFSASGGGSSVSKNHATVGRIVNGAFVERELQYDFEKEHSLTVNLYRPDFTTATRLAAVINNGIADIEARLVDSVTVRVRPQASFRGTMVRLVSAIENLDVSVDFPAVVVMNEKTGTIVMGENVRISTVAIAHGNLMIQVQEEAQVSQPLSFAPAPPEGSTATQAGTGTVMAPGGQTVVTTEADIKAKEDEGNLKLVPRGVTIQEVVRALNAIGVSPRDLITILQTIKAAGALHADLKVI